MRQPTQMASAHDMITCTHSSTNTLKKKQANARTLMSFLQRANTPPFRKPKLTQKRFEMSAKIWQPKNYVGK